jgi:hypothetical protein
VEGIVAIEQQLATVGRREMYIEQLHAGEPVWHLACGEARRMSFELLPERDVQAVRQKRDEDVRLGPIFALMNDRPNREVVLQVLERSFHFDERQVELPELRRVARREVGAQQIPALAAAHGSQLLPVEGELKVHPARASPFGWRLRRRQPHE